MLSCSYLVGFHIGLGKTQLTVTHAGTVHVLSIGTSMSPLPAFSSRATRGVCCTGQGIRGQEGGCSRRRAKGTPRPSVSVPLSAQLQGCTGGTGPSFHSSCGTRAFVASEAAVSRWPAPSESIAGSTSRWCTASLHWMGWEQRGWPRLLPRQGGALQVTRASVRVSSGAEPPSGAPTAGRRV